MESSDNDMDQSIGEIVLSVKAVMLLCGSSVECKERVKEKITSAQDEEFNSFVEMFHTPKKKVIPQIVMAAGEIVIASLLLFVGIAVLSPALEGFNGPSALLHYFVSTQVFLIDSFPYFPFVLLTDFILAILLLSAAFYSLRESAELIVNTGLRYR